MAGKHRQRAGPASSTGTALTPPVLGSEQPALDPAAHALAGSAGMFGFERLAAAIEASLLEMPGRAPGGTTEGPTWP